MKRWRLLLMAAAVLGVSGLASAATFWDDFEAYAAGSNLHGQAGWKGWDNVAGATGVISTKHAFSGTKSVEILGSSDLVHEWNLSGGKYVLTIQQYIPSGGTGTTYFILMSKYVDGGGTKEWAVQTQYNLENGTITTWHQGVPATKVVFDQWVELKVIVDLKKNTVEEYYAGELISSDTWSASNSGTFQAIDLYGNNAASVYYDDLLIERIFVYEASDPNPADGATGVLMPLLRWTPGDNALFHDVYLGTSPELTAANKVSNHVPMAMYFHPPGLQAGTTYYWRVDEFEANGTAHPGTVWSFTAAPPHAYAPSPWDGARGVDPQTVQLSWSAVATAQSHDVYFGKSRDDVTNGSGDTFKGNQLGSTYSPGILEQNATYYWRIDEQQAGGAKQVGPVWSFTTVSPSDGVRAQYFNGIDAAGVPVLTQIEPSIDHSWGEGEVAAKLTDNVSARWTGILEVPFTETYTLITTTDDGVRLWLDGRRIINNWTDHAPTDNSATAKLIAGQPYLIMMEWYERGGGATARLLWSSPSIARQAISSGALQLALRATAPYPAHAAVDAPQALTLFWAAGEKATQHEVYFGEDPEAVAHGTEPAARLDVDENRYTPNTLEWNKTYYWRVDEVNDADAASPWKGAVWSFTTANFLVVDDFDSYNDEEEKGTRIYETWIDGWGDGSSGSLVGYTDRPFAEQVIVQSGKQSMPMDYNNVNSPYFSEARREYSVAQDWTANGMDTLALYVRGKTANKTDQPLYLALEDKAGKVGRVVHADVTILKAVTWFEWRIPLSEFGVDAAAVKKIVIGVGNRDKPVAGGSGTVFVDTIRVIKSGQ